MFGVLLSVCLVPAVVSIIVTDTPPTSTEYKYSYNVVDPRTGDTKSLHEVRQGDIVMGSYTVIDPDGTQRLVQYTADSRRGFKAIVHSQPIALAFQHGLRDQYIPRGNNHYFNPYYSHHSMYNGHPLTESHVVKSLPIDIRPKTKKLTENKQMHYFTPAKEIKTKPIMFKHGEYFAPNN